LDSAPNLETLISCWEVNKFENCWYKSVRILKVLMKRLFQQFSNLSSSQRDMSGPRLGSLSINRWSGGICHTLANRKEKILTCFEKPVPDVENFPPLRVRKSGHRCELNELLLYRSVRWGLRSVKEWRNTTLSFATCELMTKSWNTHVCLNVKNTFSLINVMTGTHWVGSPSWSPNRSALCPTGGRLCPDWAPTAALLWPRTTTGKRFSDSGLLRVDLEHRNATSGLLGKSWPLPFLAALAPSLKQQSKMPS
jgi:hypothetical protein